MSRHLRIGLVVRVPRSLRGVAASKIVVMLRTVVGNPDRRYVWTCPRFDTSGMLQLRVTDKNMSPRVIKGTGAPIRQCDGQRQPGAPRWEPPVAQLAQSVNYGALTPPPRERSALPASAWRCRSPWPPTRGRRRWRSSWRSPRACRPGWRRPGCRPCRRLPMSRGG